MEPEEAIRLFLQNPTGSNREQMAKSVGLDYFGNKVSEEPERFFGNNIREAILLIRKVFQ